MAVSQSRKGGSPKKDIDSLPRKAAKSTSANKAKPLRKRNRRLPAHERRSEIIESAQRIFIRDGLDGARTRDIADEAKINVATMFHYYATKEDLFDAAIIEPWAKMLEDSEARSEEYAKGTEQERFALGAAGTKIELELMEKMFPLLTAALFSSRDRGAKFYLKHFRPFIEQQFRQARRGDPELEKKGLIELITLQTLGACFFLALDAHYRGVKTDSTKIGEMLMDLQLHGILGLKR